MSHQSRMFERFLRIHVSGPGRTAWRGRSVLWSLIALTIALTFGIQGLTSKHDHPDSSPNSQKVVAQAAKSSAVVRDAFNAAEDQLSEFDGDVRSENHDVTIVGRAVNEDGEPVAGARILAVPVIPVGVPYDQLQILAEGMTDSNGRYRFEKVRLSVLKFTSRTVPQPSQAMFQVFGIADGYGYVWRRKSTYCPMTRNANFDGPLAPLDGKGVESTFFANDPIVQDLKFSPEVKLHGTVRDDLGNPLKDALVQVGSISKDSDLPGTPPNTERGIYLEQTPREVDAGFNGYFALPEDLRQGRTDAAGRYEIRGIPRDCNLLAHVDYRAEFAPWTGVIFTGKDDSNTGNSRGRSVGYAGQLDHVFVSPVTVLVKVLSPARQPLANVIVRHESKSGIYRAGSLERTDASGTASLKLRPGNSLLIVEPTIALPYLPRQQALDVKKEPHQVAVEVVLDPAAEVIFEAVEKETGKPISDVTFLSELDPVRERQPVQSQVSFVDRPCTDQTGCLQAFFAPGQRRFFVNHRRVPVEFEPVAPTTKAIHLAIDKPTRVQFEFTRKPTAAPPGGKIKSVAPHLQPLADLLQKQCERFARSKRGRFRVGNCNYLPSLQKLTQRQMTQLLESFPSQTIEQCQLALGIQMQAWTEIITDGTRYRAVTRDSNQVPLDLNVFNGEEAISTVPSRQVCIHSPSTLSIHGIEPRDFWILPDRPLVLGISDERFSEEQPRRTVRHAKGIWEIEDVYSVGSMKWIVEDSTGFLRQESSIDSIEHIAHETWQFFPRLLATGIAAPGLTIKVEYQNSKMTSLDVTVIDSVELLETLPAEAFVVAATAGANIVDFRSSSSEEISLRRPPSGLITSDIPDVVAHRNRFAPAAKPVLKVGDEAPRLDVLTWLNANGKAEQPALEGKIIVIDFWGIGCGPCIVGLPDVNAAAKHFADSKIAIVGLHDSGGDLEGVTEFVKQRDLIFPIAIDRPDAKGDSFGASFTAFGIEGIPSCAVIDAKGTVAFLGEFNQAIETANRLAKKE